MSPASTWPSSIPTARPRADSLGRARRATASALGELPDRAVGAVEAAGAALAELVDDVLGAELAEVLRELDVPLLVVAGRRRADAELRAFLVALDDHAAAGAARGLDRGARLDRGGLRRLDELGV